MYTKKMYFTYGVFFCIEDSHFNLTLIKFINLFHYDLLSLHFL